MVKSKTGREVRKGDWLYDTTGIYEVMYVGDMTHIKKIMFEDDRYILTDDRWLTKAEVAQMEIF